MEKLGKDIIYDEIKHVVFYMNPWKAPGLDGFPVGFYQNSWNVIGRKVYEHIEKMCDNPSVVASINHTYTFHIPKTNQLEYAIQFWPISL